MRKNKTIGMAALLLAIAAGTACIAAEKVRTVGDLGAVQSETVMAKAEYERAKAIEDLRKITGQGTTNGVSAIPQARWIVEVNGVAEAKLAYANGRIDVREGDKIVGGYTVVRILNDQNLVQLKDKAGHIIDIPVSNEAGLSATPAASAQPTAGQGYYPPPPSAYMNGQPAYMTAPTAVPAVTNASALAPYIAPDKAPRAPSR